MRAASLKSGSPVNANVRSTELIARPTLYEVLVAQASLVSGPYLLTVRAFRFRVAASAVGICVAEVQRETQNEIAEDINRRDFADRTLGRV